MKRVFDAQKHPAESRPNDIAFEDDNGQITWGGLALRVERLACELVGIDRAIGIGLAGGIDYAAADLAVTLSGKRQVPRPFFKQDTKCACLGGRKSWQCHYQ